MFWLTKFFTKGKSVKDAIKYFHTINGRAPSGIETIRIKNAFLEQNRPSNVIDITSRIKDEWWKSKGMGPNWAKHKAAKKIDEDPYQALLERHSKETEAITPEKYPGMSFYSAMSDNMKKHKLERLEFEYDEMFNKILEKAKRIDADPKVLLEAELGKKITGKETTTQLLEIFKNRPKKASGGRIGYAAGTLVKGGKWFLKSLNDTKEKIKLLDITLSEKKQYLDQIEDQIRRINAGEPIPDEVIQTIRKDPKFKSVWQNQKSSDPDLAEMEEVVLEYGKRHAEGGRASLMYGGDPGFAFEYGGSWADWQDKHRDQMPVEQYIKTRLPKDRLPFREMQSGGLAYMLGEPTYMKAGGGRIGLKKGSESWRQKLTRWAGGPSALAGELGLEGIHQLHSLLGMGGLYSAGGSVGHGPWHKPTGQQQPQGQLDTPSPQVGGAQTPGRGQPNPMKGPRGLPSLAPRTMDPQFMQQQMMQKAMMGQQRPRMEEGGTPKIPQEFLEDLKRRDYHKFLDQYRHWKEDYDRRKELAPTQAAAGGGRIGFGLGGIDKGRRAFMKWLAGILGTGVAAGTGLLKYGTKAAPKVIKEAEVIARGADGMPKYVTDLIEVVKAKGTRDVIEGFKRSDYSTVHSYKGVDVTEDAVGNIKIKSDKSGVATDSYTGKTHEGIFQENHIQIDKGEWIKPTKTKKGIKTPDEYVEGTVYPDMDGKMKDFVDGLDEAVHLDFKKIADEIDTLVIKKTKKASGGRVPLGGGGIIKVLKKALKKFKNVHDVSNAKIENYIMDQGYKLGKYYKKNPGKGLSHSTAVGTGVLISRHLDRQKRGKKASGGVAHLLGE